MILKIQAQLKWILKIYAKQKLNDNEDTSTTKMDTEDTCKTKVK
jgi:hypothetical protein